MRFIDTGCSHRCMFWVGWTSKSFLCGRCYAVAIAPVGRYRCSFCYQGFFIRTAIVCSCVFSFLRFKPVFHDAAKKGWRYPGPRADGHGEGRCVPVERVTRCALEGEDKTSEQRTI